MAKTRKANRRAFYAKLGTLKSIDRRNFNIKHKERLFILGVE